MTKQTHTFTSNETIRLDKFLSEKLTDISRNQLEKLVKTKGVQVNGQDTYKCSQKLHSGDEVTCTLIINTPNESIDCTNFDIDIPIIYEDDDILIVNKPPNISVHRSASESNLTIVDWLIAKNISLSTISGEERHGIVHRLDKPTSGCLIIAKNNETHAHLSEQLKNRTMGRYYLALTNPPTHDEKIIDKPIGRNRATRLKMTTQNPVHPKDAKTHFVPLAQSLDEKTTLLVAKLFSGRTHQIRAHLQSIQRVVLGDEKYGYKKDWELTNHIFLHACLLYFVHPKSNEQMFFMSDTNSQMQSFIETHYDWNELSEKLNANSIINLFSSTNKIV